MKCYTIHERAKRGLLITADDDGEPVLTVGAPGQGTIIPVSNEHRTAFNMRKSDINNAKQWIAWLERRDLAETADKELKTFFRRERLAASERGINLIAQMIQAWDATPELHMKFSRDSFHFTHGFVWAKEDPLRMYVKDADLSDFNDKHPLRLTKERTGHDGRRLESGCCLVHVETSIMPRWGMWYEATTWEERLVEGRHGEEVDRIYQEFPSCGVDVIATGNGENGEPHALLLMKKKSSFRICRSINPDEVDDFTSPVLVVVWPGSSLRCFPPKKYDPEAGGKRAA